MNIIGKHLNASNEKFSDLFHRILQMYIITWSMPYTDILVISPTPIEYYDFFATQEICGIVLSRL